MKINIIPINAEIFTKFRVSMLFLSRCSVVLLLYGVAASMALASLGAFLVLIFWALSLDWVRPWSRLRQLPIFWPMVLLPLMVLLGTSYSIAPLEYAYRYFGVYSRCIIMLIIISVINDEVWQRRCWIGFLFGAAVTLSSTYLSIWIPLPWSQSQTTGLGTNHSVFYDYIAQGVMTSFLAVVSLSHVLTVPSVRLKLIWLSILSIAVFSITHLLVGRTGQVVCATALTVVILVALPLRKAGIVLVVLIGLIAVLVMTSPMSAQRFNLILTNIQAYQQGQEMTSIGARLAMWGASINFYFDQPIWGHGTGSYRVLAERTFTEPGMCAISCVHPHNQFLFFGVEHGLFGIFIYGWFLFGIAKVAMKVNDKYKLILIGLLTIILVDSFINSPLWISSERNFYTAILALSLTSFYLNKKYIKTGENHK